MKIFSMSDRNKVLVSKFHVKYMGSIYIYSYNNGSSVIQYII